MSQSWWSICSRIQNIGVPPLFPTWGVQIVLPQSEIIFLYADTRTTGDKCCSSSFCLFKVMFGFDWLSRAIKAVVAHVVGTWPLGAQSHRSYAFVFCVSCGRYFAVGDRTKDGSRARWGVGNCRGRARISWDSCKLPSTMELPMPCCRDRMLVDQQQLRTTRRQC